MRDDKVIEGMNRIGNRRGNCTTCNAFVQAVKRQTATRLKAMHEAEYAALKLQVERDLYPGVIERYSVSRGLV